MLPRDIFDGEQPRRGAWVVVNTERTLFYGRIVRFTQYGVSFLGFSPNAYSDQEDRTPIALLVPWSEVTFINPLNPPIPWVMPADGVANTTGKPVISREWLLPGEGQFADALTPPDDVTKGHSVSPVSDSHIVMPHHHETLHVGGGISVENLGDIPVVITAQPILHEGAQVS